jgi:hypothetical protein
MRCEVCQGTRYIQMAPQDPPQPCANCHGFATVHCCDGLREQPEFWEIDRRTDGMAPRPK